MGVHSDYFSAGTNEEAAAVIDPPGGKSLYCRSDV
jgi:hypothetical protein